VESEKFKVKSSYTPQLRRILEVFMDSGKLPDKVASWEYWGKVDVY
jgi:hypothetical protein